MPVHEVLGAPGTWQVQLRPDTPADITDKIAAKDYPFSTLVVTPVRVDTAYAGTAANLHLMSCYAGSYRRQERRAGSISGPGLWAVLGDERGVGPLVGAGLSGTRTLKEWVEELDQQPYIMADAGLDDFIDYTYVTDRVMTYRECIEAIWDLTGYPALNDHLFIDSRTMTIRQASQDWTLSDTVNDPILTAGATGRQIGDNRPMFRCRFEPAVDFDEWISHAVVTDAGGTSTVTGTFLPNRPGGGSYQARKYINDASMTDGSRTDVGAAELASLNAAGYELVAHTDEPDIASIVKPGLFVLCYDLVEDVYDATGAELLSQGSMLHSRRMQILGMRWSIREQMGVYVVRRTAAGADDIVDLSDWFVPETGEATLELNRPVIRPARNVTRRVGTRRQ